MTSVVTEDDGQDSLMLRSQLGLTDSVLYFDSSGPTLPIDQEFAYPPIVWISTGRFATSIAFVDAEHEGSLIQRHRDPLPLAASQDLQIPRPGQARHCSYKAWNQFEFKV